jgi:AcrR family transcriptional regulator
MLYVCIRKQEIMASKEQLKDDSAEEKIKEAARVVFTQKGYAATRTRDIAEAAGINLALLNYYFRSKENLFSIIMAEKMQKMMGILGGVLNNVDLSLQQKVSMAVQKYFELLRENPDMPIFVLSELHQNPEVIREQIQASKMVHNSHFALQLKERRADLNPIQAVMTLLGMIVFPFIAKPLLLGKGPVADKTFSGLLEERLKMVPIWFEACLKA